MNTKTRNEKFNQLETSAKERVVWASCQLEKDGENHDTTNGVKTWKHGKECTVCRHCLNAINNDFKPVLVGSKMNKKGVVYSVKASSILSNVGKAYLLVNGYTQVKKGVFQSNDLTSLSSVSKIFNEIKGTEKHGNGVFSITISNGSKVVEIKNFKSIDEIKNAVKNEF
jgi:hypothetical protein